MGGHQKKTYKIKNKLDHKQKHVRERNVILRDMKTDIKERFFPSSSFSYYKYKDNNRDYLSYRCQRRDNRGKKRQKNFKNSKSVNESRFF